MVEQTTDPHHPVQLPHGLHRITDGQVVPHPPRPVPHTDRLTDGDRVPQPPPVTYAERWWAALFIGIVLAAFVIGALR